MGLAIYGYSYIPELATLADPLWNLLKQGNEYDWKEEHDKAFKSIKDAVIEHALSFFNPNWTTEVMVDASPHGLAAVLGQVDPKNSRANVYRMSRKDILR